MSAIWTNSVWTEARQITSLLDWPREHGDDAAPAAFFAGLRGARRLGEGARFLAVALPRYDAVLWASRVVENHGAEEPDVMRAVTDWLRDPGEPQRRAAHLVAQSRGAPTPERLCAWAAFMAGGSVAPEGEPCYAAPRAAAGQFAAAAVISIALAGAADPAVMQNALDAGARLAEQPEEVSCL